MKYYDIAIGEAFQGQMKTRVQNKGALWYDDIASR